MEWKNIIIHHISEQPGDISRYNLLLIEKEKTSTTRVNNINRLLYDQSKHKERKRFCERCLYGYPRKDMLYKHKPECKGIGQTAVRVEMPENKLTFQNHRKHLPVSYVMFADFRALTTRIEDTQLNPEKSNTQNIYSMRLA